MNLFFGWGDNVYSISYTQSHSDLRKHQQIYLLGRIFSYSPHEIPYLCSLGRNRSDTPTVCEILLCTLWKWIIYDCPETVALLKPQEIIFFFFTFPFLFLQFLLCVCGVGIGKSTCKPVIVGEGDITALSNWIFNRPLFEQVTELKEGQGTIYCERVCKSEGW